MIRISKVKNTGNNIRKLTKDNYWKGNRWLFGRERPTTDRWWQSNIIMKWDKQRNIIWIDAVFRSYIWDQGGIKNHKKTN